MRARAEAYPLPRPRRTRFTPARFPTDLLRDSPERVRAGRRYVTYDSDVVAFDSGPADEYGHHSAVLLHADDTAVFPPSTLFCLKSVHPPPFRTPSGELCHQRLLVVTATYRLPSEAVATCKWAASTRSLMYADSKSYAAGLEDLRSPLSLELEFQRNLTWTDLRGRAYTTASEWRYVTGAARSQAGCTPGVRDPGENHGLGVDAFIERANAYIRMRRRQMTSVAAGGPEGGVQLLEERYALLTREEVLAVRLYSGASYEPINAFLRQLTALSGPFRAAVARDPATTFATTVGHLLSAIRKLSVVASPQEQVAPLYRAVRGELANTFWLGSSPVAATETGFMSCSRDLHTAVSYMSEESANVLWEICPSEQSDSAFHYGADISMLSQFPHEREILFPPFTMLTVLPRPQEEQARLKQGAAFVKALKTAASHAEKSSRPSLRVHQAQQQAFTHQQELDVRAESEGGKSFLRIKVRPSFV